MAHVKYGVISRAKHRMILLPVAASQYFRHDGINFVYLDANGRVTLALTATATLFGIAKVPSGMGAGSNPNYWLSSSTAGADYIHVYPFILNPNMTMLLPANATVTEAKRGDTCDIIAVNDGTPTTVNIGVNTTKVLIILGRGIDYKQNADPTDVVVTVNPAKIQAD